MSAGFLDPRGSTLALFLLQVLAIILLSKFLTRICRYLNEPAVIAEMLSGIILGPTAFGKIPGFSNWLFPNNIATNALKTKSLDTLGVFAQIGLIFFMFLIGLELDPQLMKKNARKSIFISTLSIILPFALGAIVSVYVYELIEEDIDMQGENAVPFSSFLLFLGAAMSITAFPVLARILTERKLIQTRIGVMTMSAAAINDVCGWILLAFSVSIVKASSPLEALWTLLLTAAFILSMILFGRPLAEKYVAFKAVGANGADLGHDFVVIVFFLLFISAWIAEWIGIHAMFGAFCFGAIVPKTNNIDNKLAHKFEDLVVSFLLPLYFVNSGLKTQFGLLNSGRIWGMALAVLACATSGKILGGFLGAWFSNKLSDPVEFDESGEKKPAPPKLTFRECAILGIFMNTRGLVELIVLNLGLDLRVINDGVFSIMLFMTLFTTGMTSPIAAWIFPSDKINVLEKKRVRNGKVFRVLLCMYDIASSTAMLSVAKALTFSRSRPSKNYGLRITQLSDRPSTYMKGYLVDQDQDPVKVAVSERRRTLGVPVKNLSFISTNTSDDVCRVTEEVAADLVLVGWTKPVTIDATSTVLYEVARNSNATVGVVVPRGPFVFAKRIILPYIGSLHDREALTIAVRMSKQPRTKVTIVTCLPSPSFIFDDSESALIKAGLKEGAIVHEHHQASTDDMAALVCSKCHDEGFDLIIVSTSMDWSNNKAAPFGSLALSLLDVEVSLLIIHDTHRSSNDTRYRSKSIRYPANSMNPPRPSPALLAAVASEKANANPESNNDSKKMEIVIPPSSRASPTIIKEERLDAVQIEIQGPTPNPGVASSGASNKRHVSMANDVPAASPPSSASSANALLNDEEISRSSISSSASASGNSIGRSSSYDHFRAISQSASHELLYQSSELGGAVSPASAALADPENENLPADLQLVETVVVVDEDALDRAISN